MTVAKLFKSLVCVLALATSFQALADETSEAEWTVIVYLNGHNNLDYFGSEDINEMEKIGSTDKVNVVVQWASTSNKDTRRLLIQKDSDMQKVTSPVVESLPRVDMGDYNNLVAFATWAAQKYPAKKYFIDVWNHGSGWHRTFAHIMRDISWDDFSGNNITTEQLGQAMRDISQNIGKKVEVYGSDACLMNMVEVGGEMADAVNYMVGSEEVEPGPGWSYDGWLGALTTNPTADGAEAGRMLAETYLASYSGGSQGTDSVQMSVLNLNHSAELYTALTALAQEVAGLDAAGVKKVSKSSYNTLRFYYDDYADLGDFLRNLELNQALPSTAITAANDVLKNYVVANYASNSYSDSVGAAVWLPQDTYSFNPYKERYSKLQFNQATGWINLIDILSRSNESAETNPEI